MWINVIECPFSNPNPLLALAFHGIICIFIIYRKNNRNFNSYSQHITHTQTRKHFTAEYIFNSMEWLKVTCTCMFITFTYIRETLVVWHLNFHFLSIFIFPVVEMNLIRYSRYTWNFILLPIHLLYTGYGVWGMGMGKVLSDPKQFPTSSRIFHARQTNNRTSRSPKRETFDSKAYAFISNVNFGLWLWLLWIDWHSRAWAAERGGWDKVKLIGKVLNILKFINI